MPLSCFGFALEITSGLSNLVTEASAKTLLHVAPSIMFQMNQFISRLLPSYISPIYDRCYKVRSFQPSDM